MNKNSRTFNSIVNSAFGILAALITVVINFGVRIVIVRVLGEEINGLHNLFQNTINMLALMEAGMSSAMIIHLYAPIEKRDEAAIRGLLAFYRKIYLAIALLFLVLGVFVDLFLLDKIITTTIPMSEVRLYFFVFSLSFFFNYLTYAKRSVLFAEQKNRLSMLATMVSELVFRGAAVVIAVITHEYLYFLYFIIAEKLVGNLICIFYVNKEHPYVKSLRGATLEKNKKREVFNTIKPLFVNQTASTIQNSSNSVLISMLLGNIAIVGYYGNYQLIISTVQLMFSQLGGAFTTSFGSLSVSGDKERMYYAYKKADYIMVSLAIVCCGGFLACAQDFIALAFGSNFVLDMSSVLILTASMFAYLMSIPIVSVQNAMGLHNLDAVWMVIQAVTAIGLGYVGGVFFGMNGILIGLLLPTVCITLLHKGIVIGKKAFDAGVSRYLLQVMLDFVKCGLLLLLTHLICGCISFSNLFVNIILKGIIAILICGGGIVAFSLTNEYEKGMLANVIGRLKGKKRGN